MVILDQDHQLTLEVGRMETVEDMGVITPSWLVAQDLLLNRVLRLKVLLEMEVMEVHQDLR